MEVVQRRKFVGLRYTKGECSKVSKSSETSPKMSRKENDGNTSPPSHGSAMVGKELRQALIAILTLEIAWKGITTLDIRMLISIVIMLLMMKVKHGIKRHVPFVDYITIHFLSVGKEWQHTKG